MDNATYEHYFKKVLEVQNQRKSKRFDLTEIKAIAKEIGISEKEWELLQESFENHLVKGKSFLKHKNVPDALEEFKQAQAIYPNHPDALLGLAKTYQLKFRQKKNSNDGIKAIEYAEETIEVDSQKQEAYSIISNLKRKIAYNRKKTIKTWIRVGVWVLVLSLIGFFGWKYWSEIEPNINKIATYFKKKENKTFVFKDVTFDTGELILDENAKKELDELADFLKANPKVKGEISGHTDNVGSPQANLTISTQRAEIVHQYLRSKAIPENQIVYKGYGDAIPKFSNDTEENRRKNRRIEFKILER